MKKLLPIGTKPINRTRRLLMSLVLALMFSLQAKAQQVISLHLDNATIIYGIELIQKQYGFSFIVKSNDIDLTKKVTVDFVNCPIEEVLAGLFNGANAEFHIKGKVVSITKKRVTSPQPSGQQSSGQRVAQQKIREVSGIVIDEKGEPLVGASVLVKDAMNGVTTAVDGQFKLRTTDADIELIVSYLGYETQHLRVGNDDTYITVILESSTTRIEDLVVVGYGVQKKINMTGALSQVVFNDDMANRNVSSLSSGLAGMATGLSVVQNSGMAGSDEASLMIRGIGTINDASPLVVVDDMPDIDINRINMNDVESISILKDAAAAAIYGSRGANGVILITTKKGNSENPVLNVSVSHAFEMPINPYTFLSDYARVMTLYQQLALTRKYEGNTYFKKGTIDQWLALQNVDPTMFPNTDWWDLIMRNGSTTNYNISMSGGNTNSNFYVSAGLIDKKGLQINNDYTRYNFRVNYVYNVRPNIKFETKFDGNWDKQTLYSSTGFGSELLQYAIAGITPYDETIKAYGGTMAYGEDVSTINPLALYQNSINSNDKQNANLSGALNYTPIKGLTVRADYSLKYYNSFYKSAGKPTQAYNFQTNDYLDYWYIPYNEGVTNNTSMGYKTQFTARVNYNTSFGRGRKRRKVSSLVLYSDEYWYDRYQNSYRRDNLHPSLSELDSTLPNLQTTSGNSSQKLLRSLVARVNYNIFDKYLFEANCRYDGASVFSYGEQWGLFPSISFGWRFSEEQFMRWSRNWLSSGKIRLSYGSLGNNSGVSVLEQQQTLVNSNYYSNDAVVKGFVNQKLVNKKLSWESSNVFNAGLDLSFWGSTLLAEFDYYDRVTYGMIRPSDISYLLSAAYDAPRTNIGIMRNKGFEMNLTYNFKRNNFKLSANVNLSYNASMIEAWNTYATPGSTGIVGLPYGYLYGYQDYGIAQNWQQIYNTTPQQAVPGDILRTDVNGDGQIDEYDRVVDTKHQTNRPTTDFGFRTTIAYKQFDFNVLFSGSAGRKDYWINAYNNTNFNERGYAVSDLHWSELWNINNREGSMPRIGGTRNRSDTAYFLDDMSFVRLKNLQIGYTLDLSKYERTITSIKVFFTGENLLTFTKYRGMDPERIGGKSDVYPQIRSYSFGINIFL